MAFSFQCYQIKDIFDSSTSFEWFLQIVLILKVLQIENFLIFSSKKRRDISHYLKSSISGKFERKIGFRYRDETSNFLPYPFWIVRCVLWHVLLKEKNFNETAGLILNQLFIKNTSHSTINLNWIHILFFNLRAV